MRIRLGYSQYRLLKCKTPSIIGASLSEPHTSVTAFAEVVCMYVCFLQPYTVNFK